MTQKEQDRQQAHDNYTNIIKNVITKHGVKLIDKGVESGKRKQS